MTLIDDKNAALIKAAVAGDVHTIKKLLDSGAEVNYQLDGVTPVLAAATAGHLDAVTLLLDRGADVNARDASSRTIIKLALDNDHVALAQALVKRYPNMIITDPRLPEGEAWLRKQFQLITENVKDSLSKSNPGRPRTETCPTRIGNTSYCVTSAISRWTSVGTTRQS